MLGGDHTAPGRSFASFALSVPITVTTAVRLNKMSLPAVVHSSTNTNTLSQ